MKELKLCQCGSNRIINKTLNLCDNCNYKRLHQGKTQLQISIEKQKEKTKNQPNKTFKSTIRKTYKPKPRKPTGERDLFIQLWVERTHYCTHCNVYLGSEPKAWMFSHIKPKSTHPELRLIESNIELLCYDCHYKYEFR